MKRSCKSIVIRHQFETEDWFIPDWELKVLLVGTFNPNGGKPVDYFYGRGRNLMWPIVSHCIGRDLHPNQGAEFFNVIRDLGIGCMDLLRSVSVPQEGEGNVLGEGYADSNLFKGVNQRTYMTDEILAVIDRNPGVCVLPTWGKGSSYLKRDWQQIVRFPELPALPSPSPRAGGIEEKKAPWCAQLKRCLGKSR